MLSDSETRINVTLEIAATDEYHQKYNREIQNEKLGGILQLIEYDIVASHIAPRPKRLVLLVKKFDVLSPGGSGTVGSIPRPIEDLAISRELLRKLEQQSQRKGASTTRKDFSTPRSSPASSSMPSPLSGVSKSSRPISVGDPPLSTQIPTGAARSMGVNNDLLTMPFRASNDGTTSRGSDRAGSRMNEQDLRAALWKKKEIASEIVTSSEDWDRDDLSTKSLHRKENPEALTLMQDSTMFANQTGDNSTAILPSLPPFPTQDVDSQAIHSYSSQNWSPQALNEIQAQIRPSQPNQSPQRSPHRPNSNTKGRRRSGKITMRDIKLPKDQEYLLEQPQCECGGLDTRIQFC